jgi:transcriptional regulator with XRE-family HTH domain
LGSIGATLRIIRQQRQLSLREVEKRSLRFAQERGSEYYHVSASWLDRLEREQHHLSISKLVALADVYGVSAEQLLRSIYPGCADAPILDKHSIPNATLLVEGGPLGDQAEYFLPHQPFPDQPPEETMLLRAKGGEAFPRYPQGIIGRRDCTLNPMVPAGSIVHIDRRDRTILPWKDGRYEFQRPIYFLMTGDAYYCGWCELDKPSGWLTLVPHPLSPNFSRRWKYRREIENLGRVVVIAMPCG